MANDGLAARVAPLVEAFARALPDVRRAYVREDSEQRAFSFQEAARMRASCDRQVANEQQAMRDKLPQFRTFLAGLNPAHW